MLDPAYSKEFDNIQKVINDDRRWYEAEKDRLEEEYKRRCSLHEDQDKFIDNHPSSMELARRTFIAQLENSGEWKVARQQSGRLIMKIKRSGFPTTTLVAKYAKVVIPTNFNLDGFTIKIKGL
jgi:hypothetical protein